MKTWKRLVLAARIWWGGRPHRGRELAHVLKAWRCTYRDMP